MFLTLLQRLRGSWKSLIAADVVFKLLALFLLSPLVGASFQMFLEISGREILADVDIARFLMHPIGWLTTIIVGGLGITLLALEQAVLMAIAVAADHGRSLGLIDALRFAAGKSLGVFRIAAEMAGRLLLLCAPFLAAGGAVFVMLLGDHDINFYLSQKPPRFWVAVGLIAVILAALAALCVRCVVNWSVAMQLHLFENHPARKCLAESRARVQGHRKTIARWVITWWLVNMLIGMGVSALMMELAQSIVPQFAASLWRLTIVLGVMVVIWTIANVGCHMLLIISFALVQVQVYDRFVESAAFVPPGDSGEIARHLPKLTLRRLAICCVIGFIAAVVVGVVLVRSVPIEDHVEITAHRAGAGRAPENTLAAVHQAIEDGADWIEIDVQESRDGVVVVVHDSDLARVAGVPVRIWEATADELRSHDIGSYFDAVYSSERVPTLAEVLEACRGRVKVNIELKYYGHDVALASKVVALVERHDMADDVVVMSLETSQVRQMQQLRPEWKVGLLTAVSAGDLTNANADFLAVSSSLATSRFIRQAHSRQREVYTWTINDAAGMSTMISRGVNNIITDRADIARQVLTERAAMSPTERLLIELAYRFGIVPRSH